MGISITTVPTSLSFGTVYVGQPSASQSFTVTFAETGITLNLDASCTADTPTDTTTDAGTMALLASCTADTPTNI